MGPSRADEQHNSSVDRIIAEDSIQPYEGVSEAGEHKEICLLDRILVDKPKGLRPGTSFQLAKGGGKGKTHPSKITHKL